MKKSFAVMIAFAVLAVAIFVSIRPVREVAPAAALPSAPVAESAFPVADPVPAVPATVTDFGADALEVPRAVDFKKVVAFNNWTQQWRAADAPARAAMREEGVRLATERRPEFKALIVRDPQRALEQAVPRVILQALPAEIVAQLEKPVSATGDFNVYRGRPQDGTAPKTDLTLRYFETAKGESFKARVFGELENAVTKTNVPFRGVAVDRELAVAPSPVRQLESGERIPQTEQLIATCPVSGITTPLAATDEPVTDDTPTVEIGERVIRLCNGTHVRILDEQYRGLLMASGNPGAGFFMDTHPGTSAEAIGNFRCLYIRITYPDQLKAPNTEDSAQTDMRNVSKFFLENSYGRMTTTSSVTPLITLPHSQAWYIAKDSEVDGLGLVHSHSRAEARKLGYDSNQFNCTIVRVNGGPRLSGISWGGGDSVWVSWDGMDVLNHECGHSIGRNHANYWNTSDGTAYGFGANQEYGNSFDVMGGGGGFGAHYNSSSKRDLGWLSDPYVHRPGATASANGIYRIFAYDQPQLEEGRRYSFRVTKDSARTYYIEYHPAKTEFLNSALVLYRISGASNCGHLLDTTPGTAGGKGDGGIQIGRTYADPESEQYFTVVGKNATTPPSLDLAYQRGPFPANVPPTLTLNASATTIAAGGSVTFTATANDANGDALAYQWDFNDGIVSTNTAVVTRTFPSADQMTVMCTASDMKGGVARRHVVINVGNHGRGVVTGNLSAGGQPLMGVLVTSENGKYCYSDTDGNYALNDLTAGAHTLTATLAGHTFTPGFANPITVVAGANSGKDWTASAAAFVTLTKTADATEGGAAGTFTLTRTGDTAADIIVRVSAPGGTAALTTDYTLSPALTDDGNFRTWTIPAGQASLNVSVAPVNDASAEGPETVAFSLVSNGNNYIGSASVATVTLNDNDTALPQVSVAVTDPYSSETSGDTATLVVSRTGATTAALNVVVAWSGTATNATDFAAQPTSVAIPIGQSSATLTITPTNDSAIEGPEDATITISSNAAYVRDTSAQTASVNITDDDTPVVTVAALDANAAEAGRDPGVFLITRTGSTAAALTIYYGVTGSALHGADYYALTGQITMPAGAASVPVVITPYDDDLGETDPESVVFSLTTYNNTYQLGTAFSATVNIADNDDMPVVAVRAGTSPTEPSTAGTFIIRAIGSATGNITVNYTLSGTATAGSDYTAPSGSVTLSANGSVETTVSIPILNDASLEDSETIVLTLTPGAGFKIYNDGSATLRLKDEDSGDRVMVSSWNDSVGEAATANTGQFYFSRTGTTGDLIVNYAISGTAINGTDYTLLPGSVTIPDGALGVDITITPTDDALIEGTETATVTVLAGAGYGPDIPASATLYLADNETPPISVGFASATGATTEAPGALGEYRDIAVTLSAASADTVTVEYTSGGGSAAGDDIDWTFADAANGNAAIPGGVLTFAPGVLSQNVRIRVRNDSVSEGNETAILTLKNARFARIGTGTHTLTISDANDLATRVRFIVSSSVRGEGDGTEPLLMAVLDRPLTSSATVQFAVGGTATAGSDYTLTPGTLTFAAGETVKLLPFTILTDGTTEPVETVIVTLTNPTNCVLGSPVTHTISISDSNLPAVSIGGPAQVTEADGTANYTITRTGVTTFPLTVYFTTGGTASAPGDFTAPSGSVTIPIGALSAPLAITLTDDTTEEPDETLIVTIIDDPGYDVGAVGQATTTIEDDDAPPVITITSPVRPEIAIPNGVGLMLVSEATRATPSGTVNLPVVWSTLSGPGVATFETATTTSVAATFPVTGSYVLRASATHGPATATSDVKVNIGQTLTAQDVGTPAVAGSWSESDADAGSHAGGTITLNGAGTGVSSSGTSDGFYFLAAPRTGDFDFAVRIASRTNPGASTSCRVGVMARASTANNAPYAASFFKGDGTHGYQARLTASADPYDSVGTTAYTLPQWVRLVRAGDTFAAWYSADGIAWTQRGATQTVSTMGASPLVGLFITSAVAATPSSAVFDSANFYLPTNIGPNVNAGAVLSGAGPWNLDATVTDDARPAPSALTALWVPENDATFASSTSVDTGVTFSATGSYRLRLTVGDGAITTFDDTTANVTVITPLLAWRQTYFGTTAGTGNAANMADMENDGWVNLVEYALLTSPVQAGGAPFSIANTPGGFVLTLSRHPARTDVTITIEACDTLVGLWTPMARSTNGGVFTSLAPEAAIGETGAGPIAVTATITAHHFFRIKVETATP